MSTGVDIDTFKSMLDVIRQPLFPEMIDPLNKLFELVSDSSFLRSMDKELFTDLFTLLSKHFIRKIDPLDNKVLYSDSRPTFKRQEWPILNVIQKILYLILQPTTM